MSTDRSASRRRRVGSAVLLGALASAAAAVALDRSPDAAPQRPEPAKPLPQGTGSFFDPLDRLDPARWTPSDGWANGDYQGCAWSRENISISKGVLQMRLGKAQDRVRPYRCAEIKSNAPYGYGTYEARIRSAAGSGLNTALFTYSGPPLSPVHDEIDFEFLGKNSGQVQLNYFTGGKGEHGSTPDLGFDAAAGFNDYAFVWAPDSIKWYVNGKLVREARGAGLPSTPGNLILSLWNGTKVFDDWLGPFDATRTPVAAEYDWVAFTKAGERCRFPASVTCKLP